MAGAHPLTVCIRNSATRACFYLSVRVDSEAGLARRAPGAWAASSSPASYSLLGACPKQALRLLQSSRRLLGGY